MRYGCASGHSGKVCDFLLARQARSLLARQKNHAHAVFTRRRQFHALRRHLGTEERIGNLDQDAGAVAHELVSPDRAAVVEVFQDEQAVLHDVVRLHPLDVRDKAHAAGVVLVVRAVQPGARQRGNFRGGSGRLRRGHGRPHRNRREVCNLLHRSRRCKEKLLFCPH